VSGVFQNRISADFLSANPGSASSRPGNKSFFSSTCCYAA